MSVTTNILQRTFHIKYNGQTGTCFTIDVDGKRYLITARHIVESIQDADVVEISRKRKWFPLRVRLVGHAKKKIDITALAPQELFGASHPLTLSIANLVYAEDVYFLGFPYSLSMEVPTKMNNGFPLPLVKKAAVSAISLKDRPILLDGHNNRGFSGGPVARRGTKEEQTVIGIVSGYPAEIQKVHDENGNETSYTYEMNTGIIYIYDIKHALNIIEENPIGVLVV